MISTIGRMEKSKEENLRNGESPWRGGCPRPKPPSLSASCPATGSSQRSLTCSVYPYISTIVKYRSKGYKLRNWAEQSIREWTVQRCQCEKPTTRILKIKNVHYKLSPLPSHGCSVTAHPCYGVVGTHPIFVSRSLNQRNNILYNSDVKVVDWTNSITKCYNDPHRQHYSGVFIDKKKNRRMKLWMFHLS